jgi:hypothetical protein
MLLHMPKKAAKQQPKEPIFLVGPAILCDEARVEKSGAVTILSAQIGAIGVEAFPSDMKLRAVLPLEWKGGREDATLNIVVRADGEEIFQGKIVIPAQTANTYGHIVTPPIRLRVPDEAMITIDAGPEGHPLSTVAELPITATVEGMETVESPVEEIKSSATKSAKKPRPRTKAIEK